jgi:hypothetical protein
VRCVTAVKQRNTSNITCHERTGHKFLSKGPQFLPDCMKHHLRKQSSYFMPNIIIDIICIEQTTLENVGALFIVFVVIISKLGTLVSF